MTPHALHAVRRLFRGEVHTVELIEPFEAANAEVARVRLWFGDDRPPLVAIAKCARGDGLAAARRELRFFRCVAPRWPHPAPALLASLDDGEADDARVVLLTEDLGALGYALTPDDLAEARLHAIVDLLVELHARFWDDLQADVVDFAHPAPSPLRSAQAWPAAVLAANAVTARAELTQLLAEAELTAAERALLDEVRAGWADRFAARAAAGHITLIHGDFHVFGNVMFAAHTSRPRVIDWSELKPGLGPHDLAYCLHGAPADDRATRDLALLHRYWAGLTAAGVRGYDWELCQWDYRFSLITGLLQAVLQRSTFWLHKTAAVIAEVDALAALRNPPPITPART